METVFYRDRYMDGFVTAIIIFGLYHVYKENKELKKELSKTKIELQAVKAKNSIINTAKKVLK